MTMSKAVYRYFLMSVGILCVLLGGLGVILPVLPTTPFLILALACFAKSSPYFHQKLLTIPYVGDDLRTWEVEKKIDKSRKRIVYLIVLGTFAISLFMVSSRPVLQLLLVLILSILLFFIYRIPEK